MPALRQRLRRPETYLALIAALGVFVLADGLRHPADQVAAAAYVRAVGGYQATVSPRLEGWIVCRYEPTCSRYSVAAVQHFGLFRGLGMTLSRLSRCTRDVPEGTSDPVASR